MSSLASIAEPEFRRVLGHFPTGIAVVTAVADGRAVGMTVQSFCSVSLNPPLVLICPALTSTSWPHIEAVGRLCVNVLSEGQENLARQFARSGTDKYAGVGWTASTHTGSPILEDALAWIDCSVSERHVAGDHLIVTCRVHALGARTDLHPLLFFRSGYHGTAIRGPAIDGRSDESSSQP